MMIVTLYAVLLVSASPAQEVQAAPTAGDITTTARVRSRRPRSRANDLILAQRLEGAALSVCGAAGGSLREVRAAVTRTTCYVEARKRAFRDAGLTSEMSRRGGRSDKR